MAPATGCSGAATTSTSKARKGCCTRPRGFRLHRRPEGDVDGPRGQQAGEVGDRVHAQLDVEVAGAAREQADQAGCGVLGEQVRGGQPQHPAAVARLADLEHGAALQVQDLHRPAGQSQATRGEGEPGRGAAEERVVELGAQLLEVHRHGGLGGAELRRGGLDRAVTDDAGERAQLGGRHLRTTWTRASQAVPASTVRATRSARTISSACRPGRRGRPRRCRARPGSAGRRCPRSGWSSRARPRTACRPARAPRTPGGQRYDGRPRPPGSRRSRRGRARPATAPSGRRPPASRPRR